MTPNKRLEIIGKVGYILGLPINVETASLESVTISFTKDVKKIMEAYSLEELREIENFIFRKRVLMPLGSTDAFELKKLEQDIKGYICSKSNPEI